MKETLLMWGAWPAYIRFQWSQTKMLPNSKLLHLYFWTEINEVTIVELERGGLDPSGSSAVMALWCDIVQLAPVSRTQSERTLILLTFAVFFIQYCTCIFFYFLQFPKAKVDKRQVVCWVVKQSSFKTGCFEYLFSLYLYLYTIVQWSSPATTWS